MPFEGHTPERVNPREYQEQNQHQGKCLQQDHARSRKRGTGKSVFLWLVQGNQRRGDNQHHHHHVQHDMHLLAEQELGDADKIGQEQQEIRIFALHQFYQL